MSPLRETIIAGVFGQAFTSLKHGKELLHDDIQSIIDDEGFTFIEATKVLSYRIGGADNLHSYTSCLVAAWRRKVSDAWKAVDDARAKRGLQ